MKVNYIQNYRYKDTLSKEDLYLLESLVNSYGKTVINESVSNISSNKLNEVGYTASVREPKWSDNKTRGATTVDGKKRLTGVSGLVKALPSAAISFLICPPLAMLQLLGAVRQRMEKKWLGSLLNSKTWLDYVANHREAKNKMKDAFAEKTEYYYTELANGEILKVPAVNTLEARDMILAISDKQNKAYYEEMCKYTNMKDASSNTDYINSNLEYNNGEQCKMWVVKFNDGQAAYAFGPDLKKDDIKKEAEESKKAIIDYYKKVKLRGGKDASGKHNLSDYDKDKILKHRGIGKKEKFQDEEIDMQFVYPTVDDMIEIPNTGLYEMITDSNIKDFATPRTSPFTWSPRENPTYTVQLGKISNQHPDTGEPYYPCELHLISSSESDTSEIVKNVLKHPDFTYLVERELKTLDPSVTASYTDASTNTTYYCPKTTVKITAGGKSTFILTCIYDLDPSTSKPLNNINISNNINRADLLCYSDIKANNSDIIKRIQNAIKAGYAQSNIDKNVKKAASSYINGLPTTILIDKTSNVKPLTSPQTQYFYTDWKSIKDFITSQSNSLPVSASVTAGGGVSTNIQLKIAM